MKVLLPDTQSKLHNGQGSFLSFSSFIWKLQAEGRGNKGTQTCLRRSGFFDRSSQELEASSHSAVLASTIWRLPLIYIFMFIARFILTALFRPMFKVFLGDISWRELTFATAAGLRGSVSLILAQAVVTDEQAGRTGDNAVRTRVSKP